MVAFWLPRAISILASIEARDLRSYSSVPPTDDVNAMRDVAYAMNGFVIIGFIAFFLNLGRGLCHGMSSGRATVALRKRWFEALLSRDAAYYDVAGQSASSEAYVRGSSLFQSALERKFGDWAYFTTAAVTGAAYALYSSWRVALVLAACLPLIWLSSHVALKTHDKNESHAARAYSCAGAVAHLTITNMREVLSLNASEEMVRRYKEATKEAYRISIQPLWKFGLANGAMLASFVLLYLILTLYGSFLVYTDVRASGCGPSPSYLGVVTCGESGETVLGAMLGMAFAGQGLAQVVDAISVISEAMVACYPALSATKNRTWESEVRVTVQNWDIGGRMKSVRVIDDGKISSSVRSQAGISEVYALLPHFDINSLSPKGLQSPKARIRGVISFRAVRFSYPTRPESDVLDNFNMDIKAGSTIGIVGDSGEGKSTIASLLLRLYDPTFGAITMDGLDLRDINIRHHRMNIGYLGQHVALFDGTIAFNIRLGNDKADAEEIKAAAQKAGVHNFILKLPGGYRAQIGTGGLVLREGKYGGSLCGVLSALGCRA